MYKDMLQYIQPIDGVDTMENLRKFNGRKISYIFLQFIVNLSIFLLIWSITLRLTDFINNIMIQFAISLLSAIILKSQIKYVSK